MKSFLPLLSFFLIVMIARAQNLVPNGSFEDYSGCPTGNNQVDSCESWFPYGGIVGVPGSPDYFNACAPPIASVPDNDFGTQAAFEGNAYMGLYSFDFNFSYREYIGAQLLDTMQMGKEYSISMRVSRGNWTNWGTTVGLSSNKLGIRLTTYTNPSGSILPVNNFAQFYEDSIMIDSVNWVLLHWNFIADSAYTNIYIGNFFDTNHTDTIVWVVSPSSRAYYFLDSINIECVDCGKDGIELLGDEIQLYYSSFNNAIEINMPCNAEVSVVNEIGELLYDGEVKAGKSYIPLRVSTGIYFAIIETNKGRMVKKILVD